ncbi:hypothetical protein OG601_18460 [Streptomyces sp. NBC_01239]|uniref:twin-arginine translocation signal domain-containing protein n=1 Tax=Streptomyces sp. NBC_01239 TaxID=2903792 RepID=UPI002257EA4F|nr:twin-arginine translocation signal domain-containing protein [Streptomyces sp. NBC_01239]MCX4812581.1 hypothetical protein [Streptomyces sp. NBC_01239]
MDPRDTPRLDRRDFLAGTAAVATATTLLGTLVTGAPAALSTAMSPRSRTPPR